MNPKLEPLSFTVPLTISAHAQAERLRRTQSSPERGKQIYLNTLAVYAVSFYLNSRGFDTDLAGSDSWNPALLSLVNTAALTIKNYGQIECRPLLPDAEAMDVPAEVNSQRLGYVAVQVDQSLRTATLLGFVPSLPTLSLPLTHLQPLEDLPAYLSQHKARPAEVQLSQWLQNLFEAGWQTVTELFPQQPALNFRGDRPGAESAVGVARGKILTLGPASSSVQVALLVEIIPTTEQERDIWVKICPIDRSHLPFNLQLMVLDAAEEVVMQAQARNTKTIQLKFSGERSEHFSIKVILDSISTSEAFII
ncbi:MAG: DUF1822 family protein [Cyanophyceae cyanobacterium]